MNLLKSTQAFKNLLSISANIITHISLLACNAQSRNHYQPDKLGRFNNNKQKMVHANDLTYHASNGSLKEPSRMIFEVVFSCSSERKNMFLFFLIFFGGLKSTLAPLTTVGQYHREKKIQIRF